MREILPTERGRATLEEVVMVSVVAAAAAAAVTHGIGDALLGGTAKASAALPAKPLTLHTWWWQEPDT